MRSLLFGSSALRTRSIDVLLVDDDGGTSATLQCVLEENGCIARITRAESVPSEIQRRRPDVVVVDVTMTGIEHGAQLADAIRADSPERGAIAVVAITTADDRTRALARAFDACLAEPVALDVITDVVRRLGADMRAARVAAREASG